MQSSRNLRPRKMSQRSENGRPRSRPDVRPEPEPCGAAAQRMTRGGAVFPVGKTAPPLGLIRISIRAIPYECPDCTCSSAPRLFFLRQIHTVSAEIGSRSPRLALRCRMIRVRRTRTRAPGTIRTGILQSPDRGVPKYTENQADISNRAKPYLPAGARTRAPASLRNPDTGRKQRRTHPVDGML